MKGIKVFLPPSNHYHGDNNETNEILESYIEQEFPRVKDEKCSVYSVPGTFQYHGGEKQAAKAENVAFNMLSRLNIPGLWSIFFHGRSYGGYSFLNERSGKLIIREHDFVVLANYKGSYQAVLIEVKSTSDLVNSVPKCDAKSIKNSKRSAQHQLRDHLEVLGYELKLEQNFTDNVHCFIFWPFLTSMTKDPTQREMPRWKEERGLHVFEDTFRSDVEFCSWFLNNVLHSSKSLTRLQWTALLQRFVILSVGVYVDEINQEMIALLSQQQLKILHSPYLQPNRPTIIHGAAGTGKTLLVVQKLKLLHNTGQLHSGARALYICYWPGIRQEVRDKLQSLNILEFVDTARYYIALDGFKLPNRKYKHIFIDEAEALCLAFSENIISNTFRQLEEHYDGSVSLTGNTLHKEECEGCFWILIDINQAAIFLPKFSPKVMKIADYTLTQVFRSTTTIFNLFQQYYTNPFPLLNKELQKMAYSRIEQVRIAHDIQGPPIYWVNHGYDSVKCTAKVIIDLCSTKGIKPNDICVLPFYVMTSFLAENINREIKEHFTEKGFMPQGLSNVEYFLLFRQQHHFLIPWVLRTKGLEFKVVVIVVEDDEDLDINDSEDRRKFYIMTSRCTCLLILVTSENIISMIDLDHNITNYPFSLNF